MQKTETRRTKSLTTDDECEKNVNLSIQWNRWLLKPMGAWPHSPNITRTEKCCNRLINAICYVLLSILFVPCGLYVILDLEDLYSKLKLFGPLIFCVMTYLKYYSIISHGNDIRQCLEHIESDWRNVKHAEDKDIMVANANFGRRLVKGCAFFMYSGFVFYNIAIPISIGTVEAEDENLTFIPMVFPFSRILIDTRHSPANEIFFLLQLLGTAVLHGVAAAGCGLAAVFAVHACGQMKVLMCWLRHLIDGRADMCANVDGRFASIVKQHVRILKLLALTEKALTQVSLVEFLGCTLDICLIGYYVIMEWNAKDVTAVVTYITILISFTFNIFIFCYIGELVAEQCEKVGEMSYMIDWQRLPGNKKLGIVLIIAMSNATMKLTAGNLVKLSLSSFTDVVNTSVAFLNMLRTLT